MKIKRNTCCKALLSAAILSGTAVLASPVIAQEPAKADPVPSTQKKAQPASRIISVDEAGHLFLEGARNDQGARAEASRAEGEGRLAFPSSFAVTRRHSIKPSWTCWMFSGASA